MVTCQSSLNIMNKQKIFFTKNAKIQRIKALIIRKKLQKHIESLNVKINTADQMSLLHTYTEPYNDISDSTLLYLASTKVPVRMLMNI